MLGRVRLLLLVLLLQWGLIDHEVLLDFVIVIGRGEIAPAAVAVLGVHRRCAVTGVVPLVLRTERRRRTGHLLLLLLFLLLFPLSCAQQYLLLLLFLLLTACVLPLV